MSDPFAQFGGQADAATQSKDDPFAAFGGKADLGKFTPDTQPFSPAKEAFGDIASSAAETLPSAGAMVGGMIGAASTAVPTMGLGSVGSGSIGAALGGAVGTSLRDIIQSSLDEAQAPKTLPEAAKSMAKGAASGVVQEVAGQALGAAANYTFSGIKALSSEVSEAFKSLKTSGAKATIRAAGSVGQAAGIPGAKKLAAIAVDDTAAANAKVLKQNLNEIETASSEIGRNLSKSYEQVESVIEKGSPLVNEFGEARLQGNFSRLGDLKNDIENQIITAAKERGKELPKTYLSDLRSHLDEWFGEHLDSAISPTKLWKKVKAIDTVADTFAWSKAPKDISSRGILKAIARAGRDQLDSYVVSTGERELINAVQEQNTQYAVLAKGQRLLQQKLKIAQKPETVQAAKDMAAKILGEGKALGKYYYILHSQVPRGLSAVAATISHLLNRDKNFRELIYGQEDQDVGQE